MTFHIILAEDRRQSQRLDSNAMLIGDQLHVTDCEAGSIVAALFGRSPTEETREKLSAAQTRVWKERKQNAQAPAAPAL